MLSFQLTSNLVRGVTDCAINKLSLRHLSAHSLSIGGRSHRVGVEGLDVPPKPKKPPTPWILFVQENKDNVLRQRDKTTASQLAVILAKEWKVSDKSRYEDEYNRRKQDYDLELQNYEKSLSEEQREYVKSMKNLKRENKALQALRKSNPPKLPRTSANMYTIERCKDPVIKEQMKNRSSAQVFSTLFKEYRELSEYEKSRYIQQAQDDKIRFQEEFLTWYNGIKENTKLSKAAREQADLLNARFKALNYI